MESYRFLVSGKVQQVFYRKFVSQALMRMQIQGYVRNLNDGRVEVIARLYEDDIDRAKKVLFDGSPASEVDDIIMETLEKDDIIYDGFEIRY